MQFELFPDVLAHVFIEIHSGISKGREDNDLFVARIDRVVDLISQVRQQHLQLIVVFGGNIRYKQRQKFQDFLICGKCGAP